MKASLSFLTVALAVVSLAFACDKPGAPAADAVSEQKAGFASGAPARDVGALQGKVAGGGSVQFGGVPAATADLSEARSDAPPAAPNPLQSIYPGPATAAMVIRTGEAFIEVDKVDPAVLKVRKSVV